MFVRQKRRRAPARRSSRPARPKGRARPRGRRRRELFAVQLEQRHLDVIGLTLVALAVYLTFVLYFGWDGGKVGGGAETGLTFLLGKVAYVVPVALYVTGAALILKPFLPAVKPLRTGGLCMIAGLLLAFAAQTGGIGPARPPRPDLFDPVWVKQHGGMAGESLYWLTSTLFQRIGAHIFAALLLVAGALLLTGTSIATFLSGTGRALRRARTSGGEVAQTVARSRQGWDARGEDLDTVPGATDVMSDYPEEDDLEPTLAIADGGEDEDFDEASDHRGFDARPARARRGRRNAPNGCRSSSTGRGLRRTHPPRSAGSGNDPDGREARRNHLGGDRLRDSARRSCSQKGKQRLGAGPSRPRGRGPQAGGDIGPFRRRGEDRRASSAVRTSPATSCAWRPAPR